ncbi:hypothetical protein [Plantibacter sp. T3]|uniref:hypothetical protein n=1 Tax=Plantibacter sp. T3 TaxID=2653161 RepID=UPI0012F25EB9|nr:hypothetical protein [Plantibacter sp. T3]VXB73896.1 conserved hypothetical protein [Plantibacter sp. T3]
MNPVVRRRVLIGIAIVVVVVIGIGIWFLVRPAAHPSGPGSSTGSSSAGSATPDPSVSPSDGGASEVLPELDPVGLDQAAVAASGVGAAITKLESIQGEAVGAGDISGPSIRVTIALTNGTSADLDTAFIAVNAYSGPDETPANLLVKPGGKPFAGVIAPGGTQEAVLIFAIPEADRADVKITLDYQAGQPSLVFQGDATAPF